MPGLYCYREIHKYITLREYSEVRVHSDLNDQNLLHSTIDMPPGVLGVDDQTEVYSGQLEQKDPEETVNCVYWIKRYKKYWLKYFFACLKMDNFRANLPK